MKVIFSGGNFGGEVADIETTIGETIDRDGFLYRVTDEVTTIDTEYEIKVSGNVALFAGMAPA